MRRPTVDEIAAYCARYQVTTEVAWRDYLQLRIAEGASRDKQLFELCVWKGAFVMRFVLQSSRASGDLDATVGTKRDRIDEKQIRTRLMTACQDLGITIPKASPPEPGDDSVSFAPILWRDAEIGVVTTSIDLSMREDLVLPARGRTIAAGLVAPFAVLHIDLNEQAAEKMRCLAQRFKVGDGHDVVLLWSARQSLDGDVIRRVTAEKLTSGSDHRADARAGVDRRYADWEHQRGRQLPQDAPAADEMRRACNAAIDAWIPA